MELRRYLNAKRSQKRKKIEENPTENPDEKENSTEEQEQESQSLLPDVTHSIQKPKQRKKEKVLPPSST